MEFSLFYFADDSTSPSTSTSTSTSTSGGPSPDGGQAAADRYRLLLDGARFADTNGFCAVWTPERHFHPFGGLYPNPAVTGAAIAAVTERVGIRAGSVVAPLHHPARIAEEWSVVDNLSGGRVGISFASGWHATDYALRPENYADRRRILVEQVETVRRLWRGDAVPVTDGAGTQRSVRVFPPPVQAELPVWVTSSGSTETFRQAGRLGAGLLTHLLGQDLPGLAAKIREYRKALSERPGAESWPGHVTLMAHAYVGEDDDSVRAAVRAPFSAYLRSSLGLLMASRADGLPPVDVSRLPADDVDYLVSQAFDRYYGLSLLGTPAKAAGVVNDIRAAGVDEIACLIDFGLPADAVLASLPLLDRLRRAS